LRKVDAKTARVARTLVVAAAVAALLGCTRGAGDGGAAPSPTPTLPIVTGDYPAYGNADDFAWIAGRLVRSAPAGQCTFVVFATRPGAPWGGRLALYGSPDLDRFPDGDMIVVTGAMGSLGVCGGPGYAVTSIAEH
jgi:hypothetical protein